MIAEISPSIYDVSGKPVSGITRRHDKLFNRTYPMGCYVSQPLQHQCANIKEVRDFLRGCKYVSDKEQFGREEFWLPPNEFEKIRKGDCDCFALWTWRQFIGMGYKARFVVGRAGKFGEGHAWVMIEKDGKHFVVEPLAYNYGHTMPRLNLVYYEPKGSVEWDGKRIRYFIHKRPENGLPLLLFLSMLFEWLFFWVKWFSGISDIENFIKDRIVVAKAKRLT